MNRLFPLLLVALLAPGAAAAQSILKCVGPDGKIVLSDPPCPAGYSAQVQRVKPNVLESDGLRKWADKNPEQPAYATRSGQGDRQQYAPAAAPVAPAPADPIECENARRAYQFEAGYRYRKSETLYAKRRDMELKCSNR